MGSCLVGLLVIAVWMRVAPGEEKEVLETAKGIDLVTTYSPFIWIPTKVRGPRHSRFVRVRSGFLLFSGLRRRGPSIILLILLLSGDVELNPGPSSDENATTTIATSTRSSASVAVKASKKKGKSQN